MKKIICLVISATTLQLAFANVTPSPLFADHMVLQRNKPLPVWGTADAGESITVSINGQSKSTTADKTGKWQVKLPAIAGGGPFELTIKGNNTVTIKDVLIGEVWICSGQSNMEWTVRNTLHAEQEIAAADYPLIRQMVVEKNVSLTPETTFKTAGWQPCSKATVADFTAVGYFFARSLYNELKVPIGLINSSWGGTQSESWTSREAFANDPYFKQMIAGLPAVSLDSIAAIQYAASLAKINSIQGSMDAKDITDKYFDSNLDDSKWPVMKVPGAWETQQLPGFDGEVWFRKTIALTAEQAAKAATIQLGAIDDNDETYVNGIKVGGTNFWNAARVYTIPASTLKTGKNTIAVKITDAGGAGGFFSDAKELNLVTGTEQLPLAGDWTFHVSDIAKGTTSVGPNNYPTLLYNAMISPLLPYAIQGAIWYQGESNADRAVEYRKAFPLMITDWRKQFQQGDFPFYFVQLASFSASNGDIKGSKWAELREAQTMTLSLPNTGMSITTDIGESGDIHPKNKQDVGKRLAAIALNKTYKKTAALSPAYQSMKVDGKQIAVLFSNTGSGLVAKEQGAMLKGFYIAGADEIFYPATAVIKGQQVILSATEVIVPVAVRYNWADDAPSGNLFNKEGFPAGPFRTDQWKTLTENVKFTIN